MISSFPSHRLGFRSRKASSTNRLIAEDLNLTPSRSHHASSFATRPFES